MSAVKLLKQSCRLRGFSFLALASLATMLAVCLPSFQVEADDFRFETKIFVGGEEEPVSQNTTLFHNRKVYDFIEGSGQITIFEPRRDRIILLDSTRKIQTNLGVQDLLNYSQQLQQAVAGQKDSLSQFLADPQFDRSEGPEEGEVTFSSRHMTYHLSTKEPPTEAMAKEFHRFTDTFTHLNPLVNPGALPPFGRLVVNRYLAAKQRIPSEIHLTIDSRKIKVRSQHTVRTILKRSDQDRIEAAERDLALFQKVNLSEYRGQEKTAKKN